MVSCFWKAYREVDNALVKLDPAFFALLGEILPFQPLLAVPSEGELVRKEGLLSVKEVESANEYFFEALSFDDQAKGGKIRAQNMNLSQGLLRSINNTRQPHLK